MKKKSLNTKKLTLKKLEISKLNQLSKIYGGFPGSSAPQNGAARCASDSCNPKDCDSIYVIRR
jgi:hypothetical protein